MLRFGSLILGALMATGVACAGEPAGELRARLRKIMVREVAAGRRVMLYIDLGGRPVRARVIEAGETGLKVNARGMVASVKWDQVKPARLAASVRKLAEKADELMAVARYCAVSGLPDEASEVFREAVAADPSYAKFEAEFARQAAPPPAVTPRKPKRPKANGGGGRPAAERGWRCVGPSGGGYMWYPGISPHDSDLMFIACDMSGSYRSADGGRSWQVFRPPDGTFGMMRMYPVFHPTDPRTVFWGNDAALLVSRDAGVTWKTAHRNGKRGKERPPSALAFDPDSPNVIFAAHGQRPGWEAGAVTNDLYRSRDGGKSWTRVAGFPAAGAVVGIVVDRASPVARRRIFVGTTRGVRVSADGGETWRWASSGLPGSGLFSFAGGSNAKGEDLVLYASFAAKGVYVSTDGAGSWKKASLPRGNEYRELAVAASAPRVAYVSTGNMNDKERIFRTGDAGTSWKAVQGGKNPDDPGWKFLQGPRASGRVNALAVSAADPSRIIVTDRSAAIVGERNGAHWRQVYCDGAPGGLWRGRGLEVTNAVNVVFDPHDPRWVYGVYNDQGVFISPDGGERWDTRMRCRMYDAGVTGYSAYSVAPDPARPGVLYAGVSLPNDLYRKRTGDTRSYKGALGFTADRGKSWRPIKGAGLPGGPVTAIWVDPESPPARRRLIVGVFGRGVYESADGGKTWKACSGLSGSRNVIMLRSGPEEKLYLAVLDGKAGSGGLYVSADRGSTWKQLGAADLKNVCDVSSDPRNASRLYAACSENGGSPDGVWRSDDGGASWECVLKRARTRSVYLDPRPPHIVWASVADWAAGGLWASSDGGSTWKEIENLPFHIINRVTADPTDPRRIWLSTGGAGIIRGMPE